MIYVANETAESDRMLLIKMGCIKKPREFRGFFNISTNETIAPLSFLIFLIEKIK